ncbi:MAG TPA: hypothetical protein VGJ04_12440 [Pirellulales bacterium]
MLPRAYQPCLASAGHVSVKRPPASGAVRLDSIPISNYLAASQPLAQPPELQLLQLEQQDSQQ